jgi:hypothetical protein
MEFFEEIEKHGVDVGALKDSLQIASLPDQCRSIDSVISDNHDTGEIYCVWGQFDISRQVIKKWCAFRIARLPACFRLDDYISPAQKYAGRPLHD